MRMAVVQVGIVDMRVPHPAMAVRMGMRLGDRAIMGMVVMGVVMAVAVLMLDRLVQVAVLVTLGQVQP